MTDGPFKNLKLDSRSKRFAEAVQNEAEDTKTRCALGAHAIVSCILSGNERLIRDLQSHGEDGQLDFDPKGSVRSIFDSHNKSEFADDLQREVAMRLHEGDTSHVAIEKALEASVDSNIGKTLTLVQEAGLDAYQEGQMYKDQFDRLIEGVKDIKEHLDHRRIVEAVKDCDKNAFKEDARKKTGLDEPIM